MILKQLSSAHVGPFLTNDTITFESDVTVITGQNDVGKTALLRLIERLTSGIDRAIIEEDHVSLSHRMPPTEHWKSDKRIRARAIFIADRSQGSTDVSVEYILPPEVRNVSYKGQINVDGRVREVASNGSNLEGLPRAVFIPLNTIEEIRTNIPLQNMNLAEQHLLLIAFQKRIHANEFASLPKLQRREAVKKAEERLNNRLSQFLPATLGYRFLLEPPSEQQPTVEIGLQDSHGGYSSLGQRGSGVRKMINLLGRLAVENIGSGSTLLLIDEPENSLHADAQHALRYALEQLGKLPNVQVIYATHSPAMINPMRPESLRVLRRVRQDEQAWTKFVNSSARNTFATVRTSLGITPADSLLYSPVTIFVEGPTEVLCIPMLIRRLSEASQPGFEGANELLSNCLFVSVGGDHFGSQCTLAKGYGIIPLIYADGDIAKHVQSQLARDHSDVEIVTPHDPSHEAEHLVPLDAYFKALGVFLKKDEEAINEVDFNMWRETAGLPKQMMLSKQISRWVEDKFDPNFSGKPDILHLACSEVPVENINAESILRLVAVIRTAVARLVEPFFDELPVNQNTVK